MKSWYVLVGNERPHGLASHFQGGKPSIWSKLGRRVTKGVKDVSKRVPRFFSKKPEDTNSTAVLTLSRKKGGELMPLERGKRKASERGSDLRESRKGFLGRDSSQGLHPLMIRSQKVEVGGGGAGEVEGGGGGGGGGGGET